MLRETTNGAWHAPGIRAAIFFLSFALLQLGWQALDTSSLKRFIVHDGIVRPAAVLVNWLTPAVHARAVDFSLRAHGGGLNILNGCEGMEALFLLIAAFVVAPLPGRSRWIGLLLGIAVVFVINQLRILTLFYAYRADHALFDPLHAIVTPIVVVLLVSLYFYAWLVRANHRTAAAP
jgi:exosortase family protein XrtM